MTRLLVRNSNGRSNGEPCNPAKRFCRKTENERYLQNGCDSLYPVDLASFAYLPVFTSALSLSRRTAVGKSTEKTLAFSVLVSYNTIELPTPSIVDLYVAQGAAR